MRRMVRGIVGLMLCSGCVTMSTPVRGLPGGMPDRVAHHQLEVGGVIGTIFGVDENGGHVLAPTIGGPQIAYGVLDNLVLEAGANLELVNLHWATHWVGARLVHRQPLGAWVFSADLELGAGAGGTDLRRAPAFVAGGYLGGGAGFRWKWLGFFARGRVDLSKAVGAALVLWPSLIGGVEARVGDCFVTSLGAGAIASYLPGSAPNFVGVAQLSVSLLFDLAPSQPAVAK